MSPPGETTLQKVVAGNDKSNHLSELSAPPWPRLEKNLFRLAEKKMD